MFENGDAIARLQIPTLGLDVIVVAGVDREDLKSGPGHYPQTPLPGQLGNASIAGHRSTYGEPFADVDDLQAGDEITVTTPAGTFVYLVDDVRIVSPSDTYVLETEDQAVSRLTLTSCHPRYSASQRIVVSAGLAGDRSSPVGESTLNYGRPVDDDRDDPSIDTILGEPTETASTASRATSSDTSPEPEPDTSANTTASTENVVSPPATAVPPTATTPAAGRRLRVQMPMPSQRDGSPIPVRTRTWRRGDCCSAPSLRAVTWCADGSATTGAVRCWWQPRSWSPSTSSSRTSTAYSQRHSERRKVFRQSLVEFGARVW